ncbi:MAG: glycosyltransferase family 39 protein [Oscillospiraceae bacterium]|nr:glycosyltransferase family 39 protein [Oscillospiraceae bacterium]
MANKKAGRISRKDQIFLLVLLYFGCVLVRYLLSSLTSSYPTVGIDEYLYYSLGRSIATSGNTLYRGQPAQYINLLYPLFLAPIYIFFPEGTDFYRVIQFWNCLLINLAIFPLYATCRKLLGNEKRALVVTTFSMLLPDFLLSGFIFSEVLIYPLFFSLTYVIAATVYEKKKTPFIWIGILGTCLYFTKPGAFVPAVAALLFFLTEGLRHKNREETQASLFGIGAFAVSFALMWLIFRFGFSYSGSVLGVYEYQTETEGTSLSWFFRAIALYPYYFGIGAGILPIAACLYRWHSWSKEHRQWMSIAAISLGIVMVGTAWLINRRESTSILFLRYMDMYLPIVLTGCFLPIEAQSAPDTIGEKTKEIRPICFLAYTAICTVVAGSTAGIKYRVADHFELAAAFLCLDNVKGIADILFILFCAATTFFVFRKEWRKRTMSIACVIMAVFFLVNNIAAYIINSSNAHDDIRVEAKSMQDTIGGEDYLFVYTNDKHVVEGGLDVYSKKNISWISMNDLFNHIYPEYGVYIPFLPEATRGMTPEKLTPVVETIVFDFTSFPLIQFSEDTRTMLSEDSQYCMVQFEKGQRFIDCMIANLFEKKLSINTPGILGICREDWQTQPVHVKLEIESTVEQEMKFISNALTYRIPVQAGKATYEFDVYQPEAVYNLLVETEEITIHRFEISPAA